MSQLIYNHSYNSNVHPSSLDTFLAHFIKNDIIDKGILIVPTRKYVDFIKKRWIDKYFSFHNKAIGKIHIYNLIDFGQLVLENINNGDKIEIFSKPVLLSIMEESIKVLLLQNKLVYYNRFSQNLLDKIFNIIDGLRKDGISSLEMEKELSIFQNVSSSEKRFYDIFHIYSFYEDLLRTKFIDKAINKTDETGIYYKIIELINSGSYNLDNLEFLDVAKGMIYFYDFTEFKHPEATFVSLFNNCNVPVLVNIDYSKDVGPLINNLPLNIRRLVVKNEMNNNLLIENVEKGSKGENKIVKHIKKWLFNSDLDSLYNLYNPELLEQIKIYEAKDRIDEVKHVVKLVIYLNKENNIDFKDICICSRQADLYSDLFREYLSESGVIVNVSDRYNLSTSSPIVLIFSLLDLQVRNWRRIDIERLNNFTELNEYFAVESEKEGIIYNLRTLISVAKSYKIVGSFGKNNWITILERIYRFIVQEKIKIKEENLGSSINIKENDLEVSINTFNFLMKLLNFKSKDTFINYVYGIKELIDKLEINQKIYLQFKKILNKDNSTFYNNFDVNNFQLFEEIEKKAKSVQTFIELLDELTEIEQNKEYFFNDFIDKIKTATNIAKYQLTEKGNIGINVTSIEQTRGIPYKVLILVGAIEGEFPLTFRTDKFLGRELIRSEQIHNDNEKILFYKFLTNNTEALEKGEMRLYIFYPSSINSTRTIRSSFIDSLCGIISNKKINEYIINLNSTNNTIWSNYITTRLDIAFANSNVDNNFYYNKKTKNKYLETLIDNEINIEQHKDLADELKDAVYSVSQLETFAKCGLKYFYKYIMKIKEEDNIDDYSFSALDLGNYYHKILYDFYVTLKDKYHQTDITEKNEVLLSELMNIINQHLNNYSEIPVFKYEIEKIKYTLKEWFNKEIAKQKKDGGWNFISSDFELKFDNIELNGLKLKGSIDRIEINEENKEYIIADYKLSEGGTKKESEVINGKALQLALYLLVLKQFSKYHEYKPINGIYYVLNTDKDIDNLLIKNCDINSLLDIALNKSIKYKNEIEKLHFPIINYNDKTNLEECKYCDYSQFCRINDKRKLRL